MDLDAIEKAYRKYAKEAYLYCLALCNHHEIAEDIVSEAFVKALLSLSVREDHFKLWLLKVCKTTWIDMCRRRKYIADQPYDALDDLSYDDNTPLDSLIIQEGKEVVISALLALPGPYREALTLFYFSDISQGEISEILGKTHGAVRTLLSRGRKLLSERLKEANDESF